MHLKCHKFVTYNGYFELFWDNVKLRRWYVFQACSILEFIIYSWVHIFKISEYIYIYIIVSKIEFIWIARADTTTPTCMEETNWKTSFSLFYCTNILTGKQRTGANQIRVSSYFLISSVRSTLYIELQLDNPPFFCSHDNYKGKICSSFELGTQFSSCKFSI